MSDSPRPEPAASGPPEGAAEGEQVMDLLAEHVPLALLVDLITPDGPASADILRTEGLPDDAWWEADHDGAPAGPAGPPRTPPPTTFPSEDGAEAPADPAP